MKTLIATLNALAALALAIPGVGYILTPLLRKQPNNWIEIGRFQDFDENGMAKTTYSYINAAGYTHEEKRDFAWV
ncbi:MAG: hypothetical protein ACE5I1_26375, partial [bacterium]